MQIKSNKRLLARIRNHEVGIKYPDLIPVIAYNIVVQRDNSIFKSDRYHSFGYWFFWGRTKEGYAFWDKINENLIND